MTFLKNGLDQHERTWECCAPLLCFLFCLKMLGSNPELKQAATNTCMQRLLPCLLGHRAAACTLPTLFPAAQRPSENTLHKPLPLSCQSHHQLRQGMLSGAKSSVQAAMDCCSARAGPSPPFISAAALENKEAEKDCVFVWSTHKKVLEAK